MWLLLKEKAKHFNNHLFLVILDKSLKHSLKITMVQNVASYITETQTAVLTYRPKEMKL